MKAREIGFPICKGKRITKGRTVVGDAHSVSVPMSCPPGTKLVGIHHTHPGGSIRPSSQDIKTMREKNLRYLCIRAGRQVRCYRNRRAK